MELKTLRSLTQTREMKQGNFVKGMKRQAKREEREKEKEESENENENDEDDGVVKGDSITTSQKEREAEQKRKLLQKTESSQQIHDDYVDRAEDGAASRNRTEAAPLGREVPEQNAREEARRPNMRQALPPIQRESGGIRTRRGRGGMKHE